MSRFRVYKMCFLFSLCSLPIFSQVYMGTHFQKTLFDLNGGITHSVIKTSDNGFLVSGSRPKDTTDSDLFLFKTDSTGTQKWYNIIGGRGEESAISVIETNDGGYVTIGSTTSYGAGESDIFVARFSSEGALQWYKTYGGAYEDIGYSIVKNQNSGFVFCGTIANANGIKSLVVMGIDSEGKELWKFYHSSGDMIEARDVVFSNGNTIITGFLNTSTKGKDIFLLCLDANGKAVWDKKFGGNEDDEAYSVISTTDGGYAIIGNTFSYGSGDADVYLIKTNSNGQQMWQRTFGKECVDEGHAIVQTSNGNYMIAAISRSYAPKFNDLSYIYTDPNGALIYVNNYQGTISVSGSPLCAVDDSSFMFAHYTNGDRGSYCAITKVGFKSPSLPTLRGVYATSFTCLQSLEQAGFHGDGDDSSTYWDYESDQEAMVSKAPGGKHVSSIYTRNFYAHRFDSMTVARWKVYFPTTGGPNWQNDNKLWVSLCDSSGNKLYTLLFKPKNNIWLSKRWDMKLIKNFNGNSEVDEDREQQVIAKTSTNVNTPTGNSKKWGAFMIALQANGNIIVFYDAELKGNFLPVMSAIDNEYKVFSKLHFQYRTGKKLSNNYYVLIDDIGVQENPPETKFP